MKKIQDKQIEINYSFSLFSLIRRFAGVAIIIVLALLLFRKSNKYEELLQLNEVVTDSLKISKNKNGEYVAKISAFETKRTEDFIKFATKDSAVLALQQEVKDMKRYLKKQGSVTNFTTNTGVDVTAETEVIPTDEPNFPTYKSKFNLDGWVYGQSVATKDSTTLDLKIKNDYTLVIGREPQGFLGLGKPKTFAQVTNKNPYTETQSLRTYQVTLPKPKKFSVGPFVGYGVGSDFKFEPFIGVGVQYNLINF